MKKLDLQKPEIKIKTLIKNNRLSVTLKTNALAPFCWVDTDKTQGVWSNNGMHLLPGKARTISFTPRDKKINIEKLAKNIIVTSLADSTGR
jgi:hypothetical protein